MATSSQGLRCGGICSREQSSESALSALNISISTRTVSDSVDALAWGGSIEMVQGRGRLIESKFLSQFLSQLRMRGERQRGRLWAWEKERRLEVQVLVSLAA